MDGNRVYASVATEGIPSSRSSNQAFRRSSPTSGASLKHPSVSVDHDGDEASWFVGQDASADFNDMSACRPKKGKPPPPETAEPCHHEIHTWDVGAA